MIIWLNLQPITSQTFNLTGREMKRLLTLVTVLLAVLAMKANPVSKAQALKTAEAFLQQVSPGATLLTRQVHQAPRRVAGKVINDEAYYYVFNTEGNHGFVIVSGDDVAIPILGYTTQGSFNADSIPENLRWWLEGYQKEIEWAKTHPTIAPPILSNGTIGGKNSARRAQSLLKASSTKHDISPLMSSKWDQSAPYYNSLPQYSTNVSSSNRVVTGCVATATAQVMYFWAKNTSNPYLAPSTAIPSYTSTNANKQSMTVGPLDATTFDWGNMIDTYTSSGGSSTRNYTTTQANAVAKLMKYVGAAVEMQYDNSSNGGSGAYSESIAPALKNYFGYDEAARIVYHDNLTDDVWADTIYAELAAGRPVIMGGSSSSGGHCFVCHGYQRSSDKYYFNWGWSGSYDGYFSLSALNPQGRGIGGGSSSNGYNSNQDAILGVMPPTPDNDEETAKWQHLTVSSLYLQTGTNLSRDARNKDADIISLKGIQTSSYFKAQTFDEGFGLYDNSGNLVETYGTTTETLDPSSYYLNGSLNIGGEMPYGDYTLYPIFRESGQTEWQKMEGADKNYIKANITKDNITLKPSTSLSATIKITSSGVWLFKSYSGSVTVTNNGNETYTGIYYVYDVTTKKVYTSLSLNLAPGESKNFTFSPSNDTDVILVCDNSMTDILASNGDYANVDWDLNWKNNIDDNLRLYGNSYQATFYLINKGSDSYNHNVTAVLYTYDDSKGSASRSQVATQTKALTVASKTQGEVEFDFPNLKQDGTRYDLDITYYSGTDNNTLKMSDYGYVLTPVKGVVAVGTGYTDFIDGSGTMTIPEDAIYVDARNSNDLTAIQPNSNNHNTLYLLADDATVPEALSTYNVVKGSTAERITLDDSHDFYSPIDFTAENISYTRTFTEGYDGQSTPKWSTIALPFTVDKVTSDDNVAKGWFTSSTDTGKNMWLMEFYSENETDNKVNFTYADKLEAYKPYIITVATAWGKNWNLKGKAITFSGSNATIKSDAKAVTDHDKKYDFIGRTWAVNRHHIYMLNAEGNNFAWTTTGTDVSPFRAYFVGYYDNGASQQGLLFDIVNRDDQEATLVLPVIADEQTATGNTYTIDGIKVNGKLPKGIYIRDGKKFVVK